MLRFLKWLIWGHCHDWETIHSEELTQNYYGSEKVCAIGHRYILRCKKCGWVVKRDLI